MLCSRSSRSSVYAEFSRAASAPSSRGNVLLRSYNIALVTTALKALS
jgi:hypothetical protein